MTGLVQRQTARETLGVAERGRRHGRGSITTPDGIGLDVRVEQRAIASSEGARRGRYSTNESGNKGREEGDELHGEKKECVGGKERWGKEREQSTRRR